MSVRSNISFSSNMVRELKEPLCDDAFRDFSHMISENLDSGIVMTPLEIFNELLTRLEDNPCQLDILPDGKLELLEEYGSDWPDPHEDYDPTEDIDDLSEDVESYQNRSYMDAIEEIE